jgi:tetratricopeptide (TPR) repeat protein
MGEDMPEIDQDIEILRGLGDAAAPILVDALVARSWQHRASLETAKAREDAREAYGLAQRVLAPHDERFVASVQALTRSLHVSGDPEGALKTIAQAHDLLRNQSRLGASHPAVIGTLSLYGYTLALAGRPEEGIPILKQAAETALATHGRESRAAFDALGWLADAYRLNGNLRQALKTHDERSSSAEALLGPAYFRNPWQWSSRIYALLDARRPEEARRHFERVLASTGERLPGVRQQALESNIADALTAILIQLGDLDTAVPLLEREIESSKGGANAGLVGWARSAQLKLAFAQREHGQLFAAEALLRDVCACAPDGERIPSQMYPSVASEFASLRLEQQRPAEALRFADAGIATYSRLNRELLPFAADLYVARGRALLLLGRPQEARDALQTADAFWRDFDAGNPWAAEAAHWYGRSLVATGETVRGQRLIAEARPRLAASPIPHHRKLGGAAAPNQSAHRRR